MSLESIDAGGITLLSTLKERYRVNFAQPGELVEARVEMTHEMEPSRQGHYLRKLAAHFESLANEVSPPQIRGMNINGGEI